MSLHAWTGAYVACNVPLLVIPAIIRNDGGRAANMRTALAGLTFAPNGGPTGADPDRKPGTLPCPNPPDNATPGSHVIDD